MQISKRISNHFLNCRVVVCGQVKDFNFMVIQIFQTPFQAFRFEPIAVLFYFSDLDSLLDYYEM